MKDFEVLYAEGLQTAFSGWDFPFLHDKLIENPLPWNYQNMVIEKARRAKRLLDLGTGGGEILSSLPFLPPVTQATEGYPPNLALARQRLQHLGIEVFEVTDDKRLPFAAESFDLVIDRHESYDPGELARISAKGGLFLTQQVGELDNIELNHFFDDHSRDRNTWCLRQAMAQLTANGFKIIDYKEAFSPARFMDISAIVYYLKVIPWQIPRLDLHSDTAREKMKKMHELIKSTGGFRTKQHRFFIFCRK